MFPSKPTSYWGVSPFFRKRTPLFQGRSDAKKSLSHDQIAACFTGRSAEAWMWLSKEAAKSRIGRTGDWPWWNIWGVPYNGGDGSFQKFINRSVINMLIIWLVMADNGSTGRFPEPWGYPKFAGWFISGKISWRWVMTRGTPISGNAHLGKFMKLNSQRIGLRQQKSRKP